MYLYHASTLIDIPWLLPYRKSQKLSFPGAFWRNLFKKMNNERIKKMRIPMEIQQLNRSQKDHGITCFTMTSSPENYTQLEALVPGPKGSPYEEGLFKLVITFGDQYPFRPPGFKFTSPVYHPNIDNSGKICLDLLRMPPTGSYNPAITLESILLSIQLLLANPNPDDPLQGDAADLYKTNKDLFNRTAREHVFKNCVGRPENASKNGMDGENAHDGEDPEKKQVARKRLKLSCNR